ncbi:splicing factor U2AF 26 kDa subunit isoform X2 [Nomascus leucogenys]|uniref:splicing factor U2AF 26 kDa subunit isoform X2 n=1 Tax=Nomascus leucogenys TaxID=61853 RepID=UPI00020AEADE|nr:splicing factor U2AF 26 kDa subunit isoform X2 [Nomascus leucogenys]
MAEYLASIFGTEKDKVNRSFYFKIGACRHGDRCSRLHNKPTFSQEVFTELQEKYGEIEEMNVCDNLGDHLVGNVYVKFRREEDAERAVAELSNRWFNGQAVHGNVPEVASATSCICDPFPRTSGGSSMGGDPGAGRPRGSILATVPERGTVGIPLITSMAASEALAPLPFTPDRDRCSWQDLSSKPPSLSCPILPRLLGSIM